MRFRGIAASFVFALLLSFGLMPCGASAQEVQNPKAPLATAEIGTGLLQTQATSNYVPAYATELALGNSVEGEFSDYEDHWFKFKTTRNTAAYKIRIDSLDGYKDEVHVYDSDLSSVDRCYTYSASTLIRDSLNKDGWYYIKVEGNKRYARYRLTVTECRSLVDADVSIPAQFYTGSEVSPTPVVKLGGATLVKDVDYTVSYSDNTSIGTAYAEIIGTGNYAGSIQVPFSIVGSIRSAVISPIGVKTYTGRSLRPKPSVTYGWKTLAEGVDYTLSYSNNVKAGTATITVKGIGSYAGAKTTSFKIKKTNALRVKTFTKSVKAKSLAKGRMHVRPIKTSKAVGNVRYVKMYGSSNLIVNKTTGGVTVKKGLRKGVYTVWVKVTAGGNAAYLKGEKTVSVKVRVV